MKKAVELALELEQKAKARSKAKTASRSQPQLSLELWPDRVRGIPNAVLRGSLFTVSQRRTVNKKREVIAALSGLEVRYLGVRLNQTDLDIYEMLLHLGRLQPLGNRIEFTAHALLKALGRGTSGKHHEELKEDIARLAGGLVEITWTDEKKTFIGHLVESAFRDEETGRYVVILDQKMLGLYEGGYSHIDWEQRQALGNNSLAKWLHGFYATHAAPYAYKVQTIKELCGSTDRGMLKTFRQTLRKALAELVEKGAIKSWKIDKDDLLTVNKTPTISQQNHLRKRRK